MGTEIILIQMVVTFVFSMIFGLQRQRAHKPTGFGTFTFVATGSCGLAIIGMSFGEGNPLPIIGAIVTGIGFLGAGALIRTSDRIFGFTTAASIWVFSIFGMLIGIGSYFIAGTLYALVWVIIFIDSYFEKNGVGSYQERIFFEVKSKDMSKFNMLLKNFNNVKMISIESDKKNETEKLVYLVNCSGKKLRRMIDHMNTLPWMVSYKIN